MKRLMVVVAAALTSVMAIAAQCEGKTQKGEQCKREAAEGSKFCIGHAEQGSAAAAKQKDDGTCWSLTEAGTRCKHKKVGDSDYCKQHSPDVKPAKKFDKCRAMTYDGKQCVRPPVEGSRYCKQHGGK